MILSRPPNGLPTSRWTGACTPGALAVLMTMGVLLGGGTAHAVSGPDVTVSPGPTNGSYRDQQVVRVSVGANRTFTPNSRVVILECADPGGSAANLPTSISACDENTIQPDTTVVHADGSFSETAYTIYALPNAQLGEQSNWQPVCGANHPCVLFVGEDQNDFSQAKSFSAPFEVTGGAAASSPAASGPSGTAAPAPATASAAAPAAASAAVSLAPSQLAFTGLSDWAAGLVALGLLLVGLAVAAASLLRRSSR